MIELLSVILKPVLGWFTGPRLKWLVIIVGVVGLVGAVWYLTNEYNSVKIENAQLTSEINSKNMVIVQLQQAVSDFQEKLNTFQREYNEAQVKLDKVNNDFVTITEERKKDAEVFEKECGRFERIMQHKASLVVRFANRATERMRGEFERTTANSDN